MSQHPGPAPEPRTDPASTRPLAKLHLWQIQPVRDVAVILVLLWLVGLGYRMSIVTVPLLLGLLLAYLFEPPIAWLARRTSRPFAAGFAIAAVALLFAVPIIGGVGVATKQGVQFISTLGEDLPKFIDKTSRFLTYLERDDVKVVVREGGAIDIEPGDPKPSNGDTNGGANGQGDDAPKNGEEKDAKAADGDDRESGARADDKPENGGAKRNGGDAPQDDGSEKKAPPPEEPVPAEPTGTRTDIQHYASMLRKAIQETFSDLDLREPFATGTVGVFRIGWGWLVVLGGAAFKYLFLTPFFFFFWSISLGSVKQFGAQLIPEKHRARSLVVIRKMDRAIAAFIRGRLTIAVILSVCYTIAYSLIGVPVPFIFGPVVGLASAVPYLPLLGWPATMLAMAVDQAGAPDPYAWWWIILGPTIVYFAFQTLDDYVLTPLIQGKNVGLSTPVILFAVLGAGALAGVYGVLIAIPIAACLKIFISDVVFPRYRMWVQGRAADPLPLANGDSGPSGPTA